MSKRRFISTSSSIMFQLLEIITCIKSVRSLQLLWF